MAAALADLGHDVVAIDINKAAIRHARSLATAKPTRRITLIEGDFFGFSPTVWFDAVCYFDGFGIGSDKDQQRLLRRIVRWLGPDGRAFIDIYTPQYWKRVAGTIMEWPDVCRRYGFDDAGSRMLDTWWPTKTPEDAVTQSLRCYSLDDLESLLDGIGLRLAAYVPGGAYDHKSKIYHPSVPMEQAMQYTAILAKG